MALFLRRGKSAAYFCTTLPASAVNVIAGTDLSKAISALNGFETSVNNINQAVMAYRNDVQIAGVTQQQDASIEILEDDGVSDSDSTARAAADTALAENATGYLVLIPAKASPPITGTKVEIWPISITAKNRSWSLDATPARKTVAVSITSPPTKDVALT